VTSTVDHVSDVTREVVCDVGDAENARKENAGLENAAPKCVTSKD